MSAEHFARQQNTHSSAGHLEASPGPALCQATGDEVGTISKCPMALGRRAVSRPASPCFPRPLPVLPAFRCHGPYTVSLAQAPDVRCSTFLCESQSQTRKEDLLFLQTLPYTSVFRDDVPSHKKNITGAPCPDCFIQSRTAWVCRLHRPGPCECLHHDGIAYRTRIPVVKQHVCLQHRHDRVLDF